MSFFLYVTFSSNILDCLFQYDAGFITVSLTDVSDSPFFLYCVYDIRRGGFDKPSCP